MRSFITSKMEKKLITFINKLESKIIPPTIECNRVTHEANITGKKELFDKAAELRVKLAGVYANKKDYVTLKNLIESGQVEDDIIRRQLEVIYLNYKWYQADNKMLKALIKAEANLENRYTSYRARIDGNRVADNEIDEILKNSTDSELLEKAWLASKEIGNEFVEDIIKIVKMRNDIAIDLGYSNFHEMSLKLNEQEPIDILRLFDKLDELTKPAFMAQKETIDSYLAAHYGISRKELKPWHYHDKYFQEGPEIYKVKFDNYFKGRDILKVCAQYFRNLGLRVDDILSNSDLYEKEGKNQHAYCADINHEGDVRILANIKDDTYWMETMLHELGHGVYSKYNNMALPYHLRDAAHSFVTEAIANMFGRFCYHPEWLQTNICNSEGTKIKNAAKIYKSLVLKQLVVSRWIQVMFRFEMKMYEDPDQDLNSLWWRLVEKYQMIKKPGRRNSPDYAAKIHVALYPCYYHNYLLGELLASQLHHYIGKEISGSKKPFKEHFTDKPETGAYLIEKVFKPGKCYRWDNLIEHATGENLTAKYYSMQFV